MGTYYFYYVHSKAKPCENIVNIVSTGEKIVYYIVLCYFAEPCNFGKSVEILREGTDFMRKKPQKNPYELRNKFHTITFFSLAFPNRKEMNSGKMKKKSNEE